MAALRNIKTKLPLLRNSALGLLVCFATASPISRAFALTPAQTVRIIRQGLVDLKRFKVKCRQKSMMRKSSTPCDMDHDKLLNRDERKFRTRKDKADTDSDGLSDYLELKFYHTNPRVADSDGDGRKDGEEVKNGENPLKPSPGENSGNGGSSCTEPNFDGGGTTTSAGAQIFQLPAGVSGNIGAGNSFFGQRCARCHPMNGGAAKGSHLDFGTLTTKLALPVMRISLPQQDQANLVAFLNQDVVGGTGNCSAPGLTPAPVPGGGNPGPAATPTVTPTPYTPPTPCAGGNFTASGNTVPGAFQIPAPLVGNITSGLAQYNQSCGTGGCHGLSVRNPGWKFTQLKAACSSPPMSLTNISDQSYAHIVAYLNQGDPGGCSVGTPTPTPTVNPVVYGQQIFTSSCLGSGCHNLTAQGRPRKMDRHPSRSKIHQALRQGPDEMPTFHYFTLGPSAPPYSPQEEALYQYLFSLP